MWAMDEKGTGCLLGKELIDALQVNIRKEELYKEGFICGGRDCPSTRGKPKILDKAGEEHSPNTIFADEQYDINEFLETHIHACFAYGDGYNQFWR